MTLTKDGKESLELLQAFHLAERVIDNRNNEFLKKYNLTPTQFYVLSVLAANEPLHIGEIIEKISSSSGNMTVVIRNMEKSGYVERLDDPADRRSSLIGLTEHGKRLFSDIQPEYGACIQSLFAVLDQNEKQVFQMLLQKFYDKGESRQ